MLTQLKAKIGYDYDFGDGWEHDVVLEAIAPADPEGIYPWVLDGKRRCPPEDVGGMWGYQQFLEASNDPNHPEHDEMKEWWDGPFDPEEFDVQEINGLFHSRGRRRKSDD